MEKAKQPVTINGLAFDALISQEENLSASAPQYAVESGFSVSDNISLDAVTLNMVLFLTDTPVTWYALHGGNPNRVAEVVAKLKEIYFAKEPVTIVTSDAIYTDMAITSIVISKSVETGYAREIPISFQQIQVTKAKTAVIPDSYIRGGASGASAGTASTTKATAPAAATGSGSGSGSSSSSGGDKKSSVLYGAAKSIGLL